jgi:glycine dehydrogenase subunit 1
MVEMKLAHPYIPNDVKEIKHNMLKALEVSDVQTLFSDIPEALRNKQRLQLPPPSSEIETLNKLEQMFDKNRTTKELISFLGGGVWSHFVPSAVDEVTRRSEFLTSYTPYQPEINQGLLQALFEFQSLICELVDMDVANCSMYDWASSLGEAARMTSRITKKTEFLIPHFIHPERLATLHSYAEPAGIKIVELLHHNDNGQIDLENLKEKVSSKTAGVYVENPSYLGYLISSLEDISEIAHESGALFVMGVDPISLGILQPPGNYGADIVIGEGQPLGNYMNFGGPLLGLFACKDDIRFLRQLPGRVVGMTTTVSSDDRGYCLTLQTREQHIRREKATSNICTNEAHSALRAAVYLSLLGGEGLRELCEILVAKTNYTIKRLTEIDGLKVPVYNAPHLKEWTIRFEKPELTPGKISHHLLQNNILGGKSLIQEFPELGNSALFCITELHTKENIDTLYSSLHEMCEG